MSVVAVFCSETQTTIVIGARLGIGVRSGNRGSPRNRGRSGNKGSPPEVTQRQVLMPTTGTDADDGY